MAITDDNPQNKIKCVEFVDSGNANTPFLRHYVFDEYAEFQSTFDLNYDGSPYTAIGPVVRPNAGTTVLDVTGIETTTTLVDNGDGTATYTNEDSTTVTISLGAVNSIFEAYQTGTTTLDNTYNIVPMNTQESAQTGYSLTSGGITVSEAGRYRVAYTVSSDSTDGDRAAVRAALHINGTELVRSRSFSYHRNTATGEGTASKEIILQLTASDLVDVRALLLGDNVTTIDSASNLILEKL